MYLSICFFSLLNASSIACLSLAPVKTTFPELNSSTAFTGWFIWCTAPGKLSSFCANCSYDNFPMSILYPRSAFATILVTLKSSNLTFLLMTFWTSFTTFVAATWASFSDSEPMIIILPDLKMRMVLLGFNFLRITAGNRFLLYLEPETFSAINLSSRSLSVPSLAKETTFWTTGSTAYLLIEV